jgi:hypothetical protein
METKCTRLETEYVAYGNEASLAHTYGDVSLIVSFSQNNPIELD